MDKIDLRADADLCVKCGLCLPHCPTYNKTGNENESPRGRIALIQAWANNELPASAKLNQHIDNCLLCRSCEQVCPARVPYARLVDNFRQQNFCKHKPSLALSLLQSIVHKNTSRQAVRWVMAIYQNFGIQKVARRLRLPRLLKLDSVDRLLPENTSAPVLQQAFYAAYSKQVIANVALFSGCFGALLDAETVVAAIRVLRHAGFNVFLPKQQTCCGALDLHAGNSDKAKQLAEQNIAAFSAQSVDYIVSIASGCGSMLQEYKNSEFAGKIIDINQLLVQTHSLLNYKLKPNKAQIILHTPCTLKNVMQQAEGALQLLKFIPDITISVIPEHINCCGSAGSYMLQHPKMANALLDDLLQTALASRPQMLLSSNIGCAMHIRAGLRERGSNIEVLHPVVLINRQLED